MIIDSHAHISYLKRQKEFSRVRNDLLLSMKKHGINSTIVIPDNLKNSECADLETVIHLVENEAGLYALGTLKITDINKANLDKIEGLYKEKSIRGFKIFPGHDFIYPTDRRWRPIYRLCQKYDFPLMIHTGINTGDEKCAKYNDPKHIVKVAKLYPKLKIIIAHYFWPKLEYCFSVTNNIDNIYFDTSALADPEVVSASGGLAKIREILAKTIKRRGNSVLFGSDWPMCKVQRHIDLVNSLPITKEERNAVYYNNAVKLFNL